MVSFSLNAQTPDWEGGGGVSDARMRIRFGVCALRLYPKGRKSSFQIKFAISPIPVASSVNLSSAFHKIE